MLAGNSLFTDAHCSGGFSSLIAFSTRCMDVVRLCQLQFPAPGILESKTYGNSTVWPKSPKLADRNRKCNHQKLTVPNSNQYKEVSQGNNPRSLRTTEFNHPRFLCGALPISDGRWLVSPTAQLWQYHHQKLADAKGLESRKG